MSRASRLRCCSIPCSVNGWQLDLLALNLDEGEGHEDKWTKLTSWSEDLEPRARLLRLEGHLSASQGPRDGRRWKWGIGVSSRFVIKGAS